MEKKSINKNQSFNKMLKQRYFSWLTNCRMKIGFKFLQGSSWWLVLIVLLYFLHEISKFILIRKNEKINL
jgi:hypothetical protein